MRTQSIERKETADQTAARLNEEARITAAQTKADKVNLTAMQRKQRRTTSTAVRAFGTRQAMAALGGLSGLAGSPAPVEAVGGSGFAPYGATDWWGGPESNW